MSLKRICLVLLVLLALAAGLLLFFVRRNDFYDKLARQAEREMQEAEQKPAINVGPNDNRLPEELIQNPEPAKVIRHNKTTQAKKSDTDTPPAVIQKQGEENARDDRPNRNQEPASVRDDNRNARKTVEYYSRDKKLLAIEHFGEGGKLVRKDIYDDQRRVRLRQYYNTSGKLVYAEALDENGLKVRGQPTVPIVPGRGIY